MVSVEFRGGVTHFKLSHSYSALYFYNIPTPLSRHNSTPFPPGFTGIDQAYEEPHNPELDLKAGELNIDDCVRKVVQMLEEKVCV